MAFPTGNLTDIQLVDGGERVGSIGIDQSFSTFENGLKIGRFAKLDTGSIDNLDGSATPVIAGVVVRGLDTAVEDGAVINSGANTYRQRIDLRRFGLCTVFVKAGETPAAFDRVFVSNAGDANDGLATATGTDVAVNAEFIQEVKAGVWIIFVTAPAGDADALLTAHEGDLTGAHAASAISVTVGNVLAATDVEAALTELAKYIPLTLADPGTGVAIPVTKSASINLTIGSAGAETNTLAIPAFLGQQLILNADTVGTGTRAITSAQALNQTGNTIMTFAAARDNCVLKAITIGGALRWQVVANDGVALS